MEYTNDNIAFLITRRDPSAESWVYNKHCGHCGKFLYQDEHKCRKCKTSSRNNIKRPIPFLSSATAIEKLICWLRRKGHNELLSKVIDIYLMWVKSDRSPESYKLEIVITCVKDLQETK